MEQLSDDSDENSSYHRLVSTLTSKETSYFNEMHSPKLQVTPQPKKSIVDKISNKFQESNTLNLDYSYKNKSMPSHMQIFFEEIFKLKQLVLTLNNQIEKSNRENYLKENKLKDVEKICIANRKKIKKIKLSLKEHQEKIIYVENRLNYLDGVNKKPSIQKGLEPRISYEKALVSNLPTKSHKNLRSALNQSPKFKEQCTSHQLNKPKYKKNKL